MAVFGQFGAGKKAGIAIDKYLEWKGAGDAGYLSAYNKETGENEQIDTAEFIVVSETFTIKGWLEDEGRVYSNEISDFRNDEITVKCGEKTLVKGLYSNIKSDIAAFGKLHVVVVGLLDDGTTVKMFFKGAAFMAFSDAKRAINLNARKMSITGYTDEKKGAIKYRIPVFEQGGEISGGEAEAATTIASAALKGDDDKVSLEDLPF